MIRKLLFALGASALLCSGANAGEPITVRGIHGAMSLQELLTALDQIDGIAYTLETNTHFPCGDAPTVSVFEEGLVASIPNFYSEEIQLEDAVLKGKKLAGCFGRKVNGPSYRHSIAVFSMDSANSGKLFSADYKCEFFNGCNTNVRDLAKDFQRSQPIEIPLREYPNSPDGTLFQGVTADGEGVGIRQDGSILILTGGSNFFPHKDSLNPNKPNFQ
ncbi:hypothetical protein [Sinorhizobium meliloti]|uniref:hypothetical protein n=1 Tax=Rhizobium meliloti TaxID=382 RepID=UPI0012FDF4AB|nr:hypothetical protein [Sinorhizobium meliloti]